MSKPSTPKGTRDFSPQEMLRRKYVFNTIEHVFQKYGFLPLETPAMEKLETLTGKYGEEGDRLIFKILNSGEAWKKVSPEVKEKLAKREDVHPGTLAAQLSEKALRYDLTVPFARYVVQYQNDITFPFKRYQIQPVWRADRPQKGRYREFYQCDADVIGSKSLLNEVELVLMIDEVFDQLDLSADIRVNDRRVLMGIAEVIGAEDKVIDLVTALDKLDKIGQEKVEAEMMERGISNDSIKKVAPLFEMSGERNEQLDQLTSMLSGSAIGMEGVNALRSMFDQAGIISAQLNFEATLARGLDYYTGAIFEVKAKEGSLQSSICGGGRYDDLTGIFGLKDMSGVGISFGADRIYDVLLETGKFPAELTSSVQLMFANFGEKEALHCLSLLRQVRSAGISTELYPDAAKMKKQFGYADAKNIPYVAVVGEEEMTQSIVNVKEMKTGEQKAMQVEELVEMLQSG